MSLEIVCVKVEPEETAAEEWGGVRVKEEAGEAAEKHKYVEHKFKIEIEVEPIAQPPDSAFTTGVASRAPAELQPPAAHDTPPAPAHNSDIGHSTQKPSKKPPKRQRLLTREKPKTHSCGTCTKMFNCKAKLADHIRVHTGDKPFTCDICKKQFKCKSNLTSHIRTMHNGEKPHSCNICMKRFVGKSNLVEHIRIHTADRPYSCDICMKQFISKSKLTTHTRIHNGDKPYACDMCAKQFTRQYSLTEHFRIHTGDKPYVCENCSKRFTNKSNLNMHRRLTSCTVAKHKKTE